MKKWWVGVLAATVIPGCGGDEELYEVLGAIVSETIAPLEGVEVCHFEREDLPCTTTDRQGQFRMQVPPGRSHLTYRHAGHQARLRVIRVEEDPTDLGSLEVVFTNEYIDRQADNLGVTHVPGTGLLGLTVSGPERGDVRMVVEPTEGDGPYYVGPNLEYDPALEATVAAALTGGGVFNVPPGTYEVSVAREDAECTLGPTPFRSSDDNVASVRVIADHLTFTGYRCE
jgi:hypothetical protein